MVNSLQLYAISQQPSGIFLRLLRIFDGSLHRSLALRLKHDAARAIGSAMTGMTEMEKPVRSVSRGIFGILVLLVAGVAFFRRKRKLISTVPETSEDWEDYLGI
jgi:hypothetical protein